MSKKTSIEVMVPKLTKARPAVLVFTASLLDETGEVIDYIASVNPIPARQGRTFEGSKIRVERNIRLSGPNDLTASFKIIL